MTRRSTYAVRALFRLAQLGPDQPQLTSDIAKSEGIPRRFLEAILRELSRQGILRGRRGRGGGYALAQSPDQIRIATVIRIVDGPLFPFACMSLSRPVRCAECPGSAPCSAQLVLREMMVASFEAVRRITLGDLVRRVQAAEANAFGIGLPEEGGMALPRV